MVVTGDRDAYQLVGDGVRVMTTSRGVTETKIYDRDGGGRALRGPAGAGHRPDRPQGRHLRQHPRRPRDRREDRVRSCCRSSARSRTVLDNVESDLGAKRKQNLTEHAEDARISKQLATLQYDIETELDLAGGDGARARPRALRETSCASSSCGR